jgi:hypothetical protein
MDDPKFMVGDVFDWAPVPSVIRRGKVLAVVPPFVGIAAIAERVGARGLDRGAGRARMARYLVEVVVDGRLRYYTPTVAVIDGSSYGRGRPVDA